VKLVIMGRLLKNMKIMKNTNDLFFMRLPICISRRVKGLAAARLGSLGFVFHIRIIAGIMRMP